MSNPHTFPYQQEYLQIIAEVQALLAENPEWRQRYADYADQILSNIEFIRSVKQTFRVTSALKPYINISRAKNAKKSVSFELRHLGQSVAVMTSSQNATYIDTSIYDKTNLRDFGCDIELKKAEWRSKEADSLRSFFHNRSAVRQVGTQKKNEEHRLESLLLTEFSKGTEKALPYIKPVSIAGVRFPMPTPISASNHKEIKYSGLHGGGIDILARTGTGGFDAKLCVIELKDENTKSEPPNDVMKQAIAYATFLRELLRSEAGTDWWKVLGFRSALPQKLTLFALCLMPEGKYEDYSFDGNELDLDGDKLKLYYAYFKEENNVIKYIKTSLPVAKRKTDSL